MAKLYRTNGKIEQVLPKDGKTFSLKELQKFVGGYIEGIAIPNGRTMYINEEGILRNLPKNMFPTLILKEFGITLCDCIRGNAIIVSNEEEE